MKKALTQRYFEAISNQAASLSLANIAKFYNEYIKNNSNKVESDLNRVGYFLLKNKLSIGDNSNNTKDVFISTYFCNEDMIDECNAMLSSKYHGRADIYTTKGFFVPSTNELVVIVLVDPEKPIEKSLDKADIRSTIEHELVHAFDNTSKDAKLSKQNTVPGVGGRFLSACAYLGCASRDDIAELMNSDIMSGGQVTECMHAISLILYKLFTITEFNAHQMSDLEKTHKADINRSDKLSNALQKDIDSESKVTNYYLNKATAVTPDESPELWSIVGNVLRYIGYNVGESPNAVYRFFKQMSRKLFDKYVNKKLKNQVKAVLSLREKNNIKDKLLNCIENDSLEKGITFWFSPAGSRDSMRCRVNKRNGDINIVINGEPVRVVGNAKAMLSRATNALDNNKQSQFEFAVDNIVDIITQSIERNFNNVKYDPVYDITEPQDEDQLYKSNRVANRFADLDWD